MFFNPSVIPFDGLYRIHLRRLWYQKMFLRSYAYWEPGSTLLSGGYAPDSAKAEGSSIDDEPGEG